MKTAAIALLLSSLLHISIAQAATSSTLSAARDDDISFKLEVSPQHKPLLMHKHDQNPDNILDQTLNQICNGNGKNNLIANYLCIKLSLSSIGLPHNPTDAFKRIQSILAQEENLSLTHEPFLLGELNNILAHLCARGLGVEKDIHKAISLFRKSISYGTKGADVELAYLLKLDKKTIKEAESLLRKAAKSNNLEAMNGLAGLLKEDKKTRAEAMTWLKKAANQRYAPAMCNLAITLKNDRNHQTEALSLFMNAAEQGHPEAQTSLASFYVKDGFSEAAVNNAEPWLRRAKEQGYLPGHFNLIGLLLQKQSLPTHKGIRASILDKIVVLCREYIERDESPTVLDLLAGVLGIQGELSESKLYSERAKTLRDSNSMGKVESDNSFSSTHYTTSLTSLGESTASTSSTSTSSTSQTRLTSSTSSIPAMLPLSNISSPIILAYNNLTIKRISDNSADPFKMPLHRHYCSIVVDKHDELILNATTALLIAKLTKSTKATVFMNLALAPFCIMRIELNNFKEKLVPIIPEGISSYYQNLNNSYQRIVKAIKYLQETWNLKPENMLQTEIFSGDTILAGLKELLAANERTLPLLFEPILGVLAKAALFQNSPYDFEEDENNQISLPIFNCIVKRSPVVPAVESNKSSAPSLTSTPPTSLSSPVFTSTPPTSLSSPTLAPIPSSPSPDIIVTEERRKSKEMMKQAKQDFELAVAAFRAIDMSIGGDTAEEEKKDWSQTQVKARRN